MKKIIVLLFIVFAFAQSVFASNWYEATKTTYVDLDSLRTVKLKVRDGFWGPIYETRYRFYVKYYNPGNWKLEKGQEVWYALVEWETDGIKNRVSQEVNYNKKDQVISSFDFDRLNYYELSYPVPDSIGAEAQVIFKFMYNRGFFH